MKLYALFVPNCPKAACYGLVHNGGEPIVSESFDALLDRLQDWKFEVNTGRAVWVVFDTETGRLEEVL